MSGDNLDEEFVPEEDAENPIGAIKKLRERLRSAEIESKNNLEGWQRSQADFVNFKRDEETRRLHTQDRIKASLAEDLIPVLDSFEMASKHAPSKEFEILHKQLLDTVVKMNIELFGAEGEPFDPRRHEALREVEVEAPEKDHTVVTVERSGYSIGNYIIRPAQVSVGRFAEMKKN